MYEMTTSFVDLPSPRDATDLPPFDLLNHLDMTSPEPLTEVPGKAQVSQVLSGSATYLATTVIFCAVSVISAVGIFLNIINVIVFVRLGVAKETINIGMCALSVADLLTLIVLLLMGMVNSPIYPYLDIPMAPYDATLLLTGPFMTASVTSHCMTALISFERCVCVVKPLHVKRIVTVNRVRAAVVGIFVLPSLGTVPKYATTNLTWRMVSGENSTGSQQLQFEYTPLMRKVEELTIQIMNVLIPFLMYLLVVVFTIILVVKLRQVVAFRTSMKKMQTKSSLSEKLSKSDSGVAMVSSGSLRCGEESKLSDRSVLEKTRYTPSTSSLKSMEPPLELEGTVNIPQDMTAVADRVEDKEEDGLNCAPPQRYVLRKPRDDVQPHNTSNAKYLSVRELRVLKSVILICVIFLTCTSPTVILITIYLAWPKFHVDTPEFKNLMHLLISFPFFTQAISSSVNIVFYLRMSSRFRPVCLALFRWCCRRPVCP